MAGKLSKVNLNDYKPLRDVIFDTLREAIIAGELKPGQRLMEVQLAEKMGVSRTPVREAIRKLELEGLVEMLPRKGAHVAELSVKDIMDVLEVRATLDGLATSLSAKHIGEDGKKELRHILDQFINCVEKENLQGSIKKDVEFNDVIYRSSGNYKLIKISNKLREQFHRFRVEYIRITAVQELMGNILEIYEAIISGDPETAMRAAQRHIKNQEESIIRSLKKKHSEA